MSSIDSIKTYEGNMTVPEGAKFALVVSRFNSLIVEQLVMGAIDTLLRHGSKKENIEIIRVPGAWESPLVAQRLAKSGKYDAVVVLGAVIRGGTAHFEYVAGEAAKGLASAALSSGVPVVFGILTTDSIEQAIERAGTKAGNKGAEATLAAIEMVSLDRQLKGAGL